MTLIGSDVGVVLAVPPADNQDPPVVVVTLTEKPTPDAPDALVTERACAAGVLALPT